MISTLHISSPAQKPTNVRYTVLAFACALSAITYLDRVCIGSAVPYLLEALGLDPKRPEQLAWALTAFSIAYAVFEVPSGWLGDRFGPRMVLIRIVLWWSVFTAATSLTTKSFIGPQFGFWSLVAMRFLFGMGEAGAYPNITRALHNWFPFKQRGLAQGAVWMAGRGMGGLTPLLWMFLVKGIVATSAGEDSREMTMPPLLKPLAELLDLDIWRVSFLIFGVIGLLWCLLFAWWFRNHPQQKQSVNEAELELIQAGRLGTEEGHGNTPWFKLLTDRNLWALCLMYFCASYAWYFNINYLPMCLEEQYGVKTGNILGAIYKGGPLWMGALACLLGGFLTDWFIRRTGDRKWGRRLFGLIGHGLCALCYLACMAAPSALTFFLAISFAAFFNDLTMGASWATCQDIGRRYSATVAGCMNTIGNLGGAVGTFITGVILTQAVKAYENAHGIAIEAMQASSSAPDRLAADEALKAAHWPGYQLSLLSFAGVYFVGVLLWLFIDATRPVAEDA
ncbi:MAG TPA: MFS transporter [Gemmataceae bacterium]|nr:MFS transporter [Gemmataceae bacterium]